MTLSSSLNAGVAGLSVNASKLGTIADNIANSATNGYKRVDTEFANLVLSEGDGIYSAGGVVTSTFREVDQRGGLTTTNNATDLAIGGRGLLPVTPLSSVDNADSDLPLNFVTTGSFRADENGFLVTNTGLSLLGVAANADGSIPEFARDTGRSLEPVRILSSQLSGSPTTEINFGLNLPAELSQAGQPGDPLILTRSYFDNVGATQTLSITFTPTIPAAGSSNEWSVEFVDSATDPVVPVASFTAQFDTSRELAGNLAAVPAEAGGTYDAATGEFTFNVAGGPLSVNIGIIGEQTPFTQLSAEFLPAGVTVNGAPVASVENIRVDENGFLTATFGGGFTRTLYQIPVADFPNLNGLRALDNQTFQSSADSGSVFLWDAGDGPTGPVVSFALEGSTTDVATELTSLIETQRAYSSNANVIRTVDEMLQETTNL